MPYAVAFGEQEEMLVRYSPVVGSNHRSCSRALRPVLILGGLCPLSRRYGLHMGEFKGPSHGLWKGKRGRKQQNKMIRDGFVWFAVCRADRKRTHNQLDATQRSPLLA